MCGSPGGAFVGCPVSRVLPDGFHDEPLRPPSGRSVAMEALVLREVPRLLLSGHRLAAAPKGRRQPVMALPGHSSSDAATAPLRTYLSWLGYDARGWGLGTNHGDVQALLPHVEAAVARHMSSSGSPVHLIGWSLGGVLAREVARDRPDLVAQVITYGTPVVGGPAFTLAASSYGPARVQVIADQAAERTRVPISVPVTAFFSRRDQVVAWRACIDRDNDHVEHVEVGSTHLGLGVDPDVWLGITRRLASPAPTPPPGAGS